MESHYPADPRPILPVIFGFDIADYAFARIFHESLGVRSLVISEIARGPINDSKIFDVQFVAKSTLGNEDRFISLLHQISAEHPDERLILCVNTDEGVDFAMKHASELEPHWFLPYASAQAVQRANSKSSMADLFASLGLNAPARTIVDLTSRESWDGALAAIRFPAVVKPENGADLDVLWKKGLKKVMPTQSPDEAKQYFESLADNAVTVPLIAQELIMGDDTTQWVINGYVDSRGVVTAAGSGRVLLGLHQPNLIGNAAMILLEHNDGLIEAAKRVVRAAGMHGFFSIDVKFDSRNAQPYWLDLNPRIGRGHYYLKIGGIDLVAAMMADMRGEEITYQTNSLDGIYTVIPSNLANSTYIQDPHLLRKVKSVKRRRRPINPLQYAQDRHIRRTIYRCVNNLNQFRQMRQYNPRPTQTGF
ncbi:carboxylate--amine ligase [Changpingibacter yushuensis]|uniref:carboxylate--amine ligase n=1 Tax=Changpingibacter yushuensis TaxID=2758440 RepID=UPI00165E503B|nr:ATP-grasp domain-containing protein [Changpingibacter yushuensis]